MPNVLLTGGAGFIGSHTAVELLNAGENVIIVDNLYNSDSSVIDRIEIITGKRPVFYKVDVCDKKMMDAVFKAHKIDSVIHFAGYKAVGESVKDPLKYYRNNIDTLLTTVEVMRDNGCHNMVFSSSATVYSVTEKFPFTEDEKQIGCISPYGWTKYMIEQILRDTAAADSEFSAVLLRYFNPLGAHESGLIGEKPNGVPENLLPYITQTAIGIREKLTVYGNDYPTPDGTCIRDYIHVVDLAKGHLAALNYALKNQGCETFNLGSGKGYSVLEVISAFEKANNIKIPYVIGPRRAGDNPFSYASTEKAEKLLEWKAEKTMEDMCRDSWRWQQSKWAL